MRIGKEIIKTGRAASESNAEDSDKGVEGTVFIADADLAVGAAVPVTVGLYSELALHATLLLLHDLRSD